MNLNIRRLVLACCLVGTGLGNGETFRAAEIGIVVTDLTSKTGRVPCRIHITDADGKAVLPKGQLSYRDHFIIPDKVDLNLEPGDYTFEFDRGPEFELETRKFRVSAKPNGDFLISLKRIANMAAAGWWSGELHVHRDRKDIELLMQAEDLHVAPVITWWNDRNLWKDHPLPKNPLVKFDENRFYHLMAGEDEREGGALMYFNLPQPLEIIGATREYPSPMSFLQAARKHPDVWIDIEKPFWWDVPIWLASGEVDSIGLANNHMCRNQMYESEAWGKPRDAKRLPPPLGNGMWTQELYYKVLDSGLRIPPSAGSASGVLPNPVGYNRVYVQLDGELTYEKWWEGLRAGRSFVTNGPLLQVKANGQSPGHIFTADGGQTIDIELAADIQSRDAVEAIEIIKNGKVVHSLSPDDTEFTGKFTQLTFENSGWFLVRARCKIPRTFRFASTAPFYVKIGDEKTRISKAAAQFFLDWVNEREARVKLIDPQMRREVLKHHTAARDFWQQRVDAANAE